MKNTLFKLILVSIFAFLGIWLLWYKTYYTHSITKNSDGYIDFLKLNKNLAELENEIFEVDYFLYIDNDKIIKRIKKIDTLIQHIKNGRYFNSKAHKIVYTNFLIFIKQYKQYKNNLYKFLTYNATIKNSTIYIPTLVLRSFSIFNQQKDINLIIFLNKIGSEIFIAKNAKDYSFINDLKNYLKQLKNISNKRVGNQKEFLLTFEKHLEVFTNYFPKSVKLVEKLSDGSLDRTLNKIIKKFQQSSEHEINKIKYYDMIFNILFIFSILTIVYYIFYTNRQNRKLKNMLTTDSLTNLRNRFAFKKDKKKFTNPMLILINIDRFRDINEFYGTIFGDRVLIEFANILKFSVLQILNKNHFCYRFGADNFGIIFEKDSNNFTKIAKSFLKKVDNLKIEIDEIEIEISISIGISSNKNRLFESAEMALKKAKEDKRKKFYIYSKEIDKTKDIEKNIYQIKELKLAIEENRIISQFQPIFNPKNNKIIKYEALARIIKNGGEIIYPKDFLPAAKISKLSGEITKIMLKHTIAKIKESKNSFSVNISYEDIENQEDREEILNIIQKNQELAKYLTLEVLESEEIENYVLYEEFIKRAKKLGCSIAIDDFGSGYSNFDRILKLNIDSLKIDGSLIKDIDKNKKSYLIVSTIVEFTKKAGIKTVAEFVHSREILEIVKMLDMDGAQGFFLGKPKMELL